MSGNITSIKLLCQPTGGFEVHLVLIKKSGSEHKTSDGLHYSTVQWKIKWTKNKFNPFTDTPIAYEAKDFILYRVKDGSSNPK